ncbi:glycosyltransferase family 2 protein [Nocardioides yefusunii]|uniref:Glycosyltransferase family 2 protein n=1 Tax=Nocardioides yefusunii TaxID=2500546 RepID=A0ABW1QVL5_9ACTN|nr:glycosyltransferase family 2 protein [Nocardioides yefusunii]
MSDSSSTVAPVPGVRDPAPADGEFVAEGRRSVQFLLPVYDEEEGIEHFHAELASTVAVLEDRYDVSFLYVDDGSADSSLEKLIELREHDERVCVVSFSRNFGHQKAITAALDMCEADAAIIMDTDLQDPPRVALELVEKWEQGVDVVYAQRRTREDSRFKRFSADAYYRLLARMASIEIPRNTGDFRLMDRRVVLELRKYREQNRFMRGLVSYVGFRQEAVLFDRDARFAGATGYPLKKMLRFAGDGIFGFSTVPLQVISRVGYFVSFLSVLGAVYALGVKLFAPESSVPGWAFLSIVVLLIGGIQITMLGILGAYVGRTYAEVQRRPLYSVQMVAGSPSGVVRRGERR